ncbi:MAG: glycosyltransferase [Planctomycetes bacterium SCN 63-9]|nr:MAG: glycosyltransferase [Planctomycetes bacterium SCN 63-9]
MQSLSDRLAATSDLAQRRPWPDRPVRLTFAITDLDVGGAERALVSLATRLDRRRWQPSVICLSGEGELAKVLRQEGIPCNCLKVNPHHPLLAVARIAWAIRGQRPELIQSFLFHANLAVKLASLCPGTGRPWIVGGLRVAERQRRWHLTLDRLTARLSAGAVCVSEGVRRFSQEAGLPAARLTVIPNGIDPRPFDQAAPADRRELGISESSHLALYVGRLDPQKGLPDLLAAAEWVGERTADWHLLVAGDGPERDRLVKRLASADSHPSHWVERVRVLGRRADIPSLMKSADLLVLPSLWEGMPNVILEAMAAGLAVVATRVEGSEDLVIPEQTGWLVPPGDPSALGHALLEASRNPERCHAYGAAGRRRVEEFFTPEAVVASYERLWAGLLGYRFP